MLGLATLLLLSTTAWFLSPASGLALGFHALNYIDNRISLTHDAFPSNAQVFTLLMPSFDPTLGRRQTSPTITDIAQTSNVDERRTRRPHFSRSISTSTTSTSTSTTTDTQAETTTSDQSQTPIPSDTQSDSTTESTSFITETATIPPSVPFTPSVSSFTPSAPVMNMQTGKASPSPSTPSVTPAPSSSHTTAIIVGIVVPGSLIIVGLFVVIYLLLRKRRNRELRTAAYYRDMMAQSRLAEEKLAASHERLLEGMRRERERAQASTSAPITRTLSRLNLGDSSPRTADSGRVSSLQQATPSPGTALEVTETSSDTGSIVFARTRPQSNQSLGPTPPSALSKATPTPIAESSDSGSILFFRQGLRSPSPPGSFPTSLTLKSVTVQTPWSVSAPPNPLSLPQTPPSIPEASSTVPPEKLSKFWFVRRWKS